MRNFASDNHAGAHPDVLEALAEANDGRAGAYGNDAWTERVEELFRRHFGADARGFPVFNGSGANVAVIDALTRGFEAVICTDIAHLHVDECGAPERIAGAKLYTVAAREGKLRAGDLDRWESRRGDDHHAQQRVVSITQATELGTVYSAEETSAIAERAHELGMLLHVDGARLANAAASLDVSLGELTTDCGVDALSFGATKNGLAFGDAVVFLRPELADGFEFVRKQLGQLASKMRFVSAQLEALLEGELWLRNARHANAMAARLAEAVAELPEVQVLYPVEANAVFATLPVAASERLQAELAGDPPFYVWDEETGAVRWMCAWDTEPSDVDKLAAAVEAAVT
ncbi:MAG: beta-eliminating lyase-related protein [Actinomycetota bacterium]|nr:beta-eliminating lyase-related protein [Actinomycetota bacterium]